MFEFFIIVLGVLAFSVSIATQKKRVEARKNRNGVYNGNRALTNNTAPTRPREPSRVIRVQRSTVRPIQRTPDTMKAVSTVAARGSSLRTMHATPTTVMQPRTIPTQHDRLAMPIEVHDEKREDVTQYTLEDSREHTHVQKAEGDSEYEYKAAYSTQTISEDSDSIFKHLSFDGDDMIKSVVYSQILERPRRRRLGFVGR